MFWLMHLELLGSTWKLSLFIIILKKLYVYLIRAIKLLVIAYCHR